MAKIDFSKPFEQLTTAEKEELTKNLYQSRQTRKAKVAGKKKAVAALIAKYPAEYEKLLKTHGGV